MTGRSLVPAPRLCLDGNEHRPAEAAAGPIIRPQTNDPSRQGRSHDPPWFVSRRTSHLRSSLGQQTSTGRQIIHPRKGRWSEDQRGEADDPSPQTLRSADLSGQTSAGRLRRGDRRGRPPVLSTWTMPEITRRSWIRRAPGRFVGMIGPITAPCSSLSQNRSAIATSAPLEGSRIRSGCLHKSSIGFGPWVCTRCP